MKLPFAKAHLELVLELHKPVLLAPAFAKLPKMPTPVQHGGVLVDDVGHVEGVPGVFHADEIDRQV